MSGVPTEVWARLASSQPIGESLTARLAAPERTDRLLCAIDVALQRHLLIRLGAAEDALLDTESRGLRVETRELSILGHDPARYIDIACRDAAGHDALDMIGGEVADGLSRAVTSPAEIVHQVLAKWRRFWGQLPRHLLTREEQLGLFAELWFLNTWLAKKVGPGEAVRRWRGPFGARHDFEWVGRSVEVKATTSTRGPVHRINGIDQLAPPENGDLLFFSLRLREEASASKTLPNLVLSCREEIGIDDEVLAQLEAGLVQAGYSLIHEEDYAKLRLRVVEEGLFVVNDTFPRLTPSHFEAGIPNGVERIDYEINLSGFMGHRIARNVDELSSI